MEDIVNNYPELLEKTIKIFGETHLGFEKFMKILPKNKFKCVWKEEHNNGTCPFELSRV